MVTFSRINQDLKEDISKFLKVRNTLIIKNDIEKTKEMLIEFEKELNEINKIENRIKDSKDTNELFYFKKFLKNLNLFDLQFLAWDTLPSNIQQINNYAIQKSRNQDSFKLAFSSYVFQPKSKNVYVQFKISCYSQVGVGVVEAQKVKNLDFSCNYLNIKHGTTLWFNNGDCFSNNPTTHDKNILNEYKTGDFIKCKISSKKNAIFMKKVNDINWYEFSVTFPVCLCAFLNYEEDKVEILK